MTELQDSVPLDDNESRFLAELATSQKETQAQIASTFVKNRRRARIVPLWTIAACIILGVVALWAVRLQARTPEKLLAAAYTAARPFEYRLLQRAEHSGFSQTRAANRLVPPVLSDATATIESRLAKNPTDRQLLRLRGQAALLRGDFVTAIEDFQSAGSNNDRAVAYAVRSDATGDKADLERALSYLSRPNDDQELFNRALLLERLGRETEARQAWEQFVNTRPSSAWAQEARAHLSENQPKRP